MSAGVLDIPKMATVHKRTDGFLFEWSTETGNPKDTLLVIAYDEIGNAVDYKFTGEQRYKGHFLWNCDLIEQHPHIWMAFRKNDESEMSNSLYLGTV